MKCLRYQIVGHAYTASRSVCYRHMQARPSSVGWQAIYKSPELAYKWLVRLMAFPHIYHISSSAAPYFTSCRHCMHMGVNIKWLQSLSRTAISYPRHEAILRIWQSKPVVLTIGTSPAIVVGLRRPAFSSSQNHRAGELTRQPSRRFHQSATYPAPRQYLFASMS